VESDPKKAPSTCSLFGLIPYEQYFPYVPLCFSLIPLHSFFLLPFITLAIQKGYDATLFQPYAVLPRFTNLKAAPETLPTCQGSPKLRPAARSILLLRRRLFRSAF